MQCERHGEVGATLEGRCRQCVREELIAQVTRIAHHRPATRLSREEKELLSQLPRLELWPRDFPWLTDDTFDPARQRWLRTVLAQAYVDVGVETLHGGQAVQALMLLGSASAFEAPDHLLQWQIHFHTALAIRETLHARAEYGKEQMSEGSVKFLAGIACHVEIGFQHLVHAGGLESNPRESENYHIAEQLRQEVLAMDRFAITAGRVVGNKPIRTGNVETFLFPSVSKGPGLE